jgi:hypothetical protein
VEAELFCGKARLGNLFFQGLQQLVSGQLNVVVALLGGALLGGNQAVAAHGFEVAVGKLVAAFCVFAQAFVFPQMPLGVLVDFMLFEKSIFGGAVGVVLAPVALVVPYFTVLDKLFGERNRQPY